ncbi:uncharacterized protein LOC119381855 [Rhipicephalus sanguineus]|uniref:uncharacterized protein LOC119381855 n=1 Tax=Rhipicephalus sanguineus TaxID=34632 RepID=UPI0020C48489|nr:uncharacterized protein LOC119381855 [Rhipicephalus sanguineus]
MGSVGAVSAAVSGRGNRVSAASDNEYRVVLPSLPSGSLVLNTVFMHGDVRARPYRVEDFRDTLSDLKLLPEVSSLGAYQMNHVWAVTFKCAEGAKRLLEKADVKVKGQRCVLIDPSKKELRLKLHWLLPTVPDDDVRAALLNYGRVTDIVKERWKVSGVSDNASTTRTVTMNLKAGVKPEDIPHQIRIAGELALVVVPGRAPLCLRCQCTGHIRRDCNVPRCTLCRRFGHTETECVRTYASVAGPVGSDDNSELLMDEADSEAAASAETESATTDSAPAEQISGEKVRAGPANFKGEGALPVTDEASEAALARDEKSKAPVAGGKKEAEEAMDISKEGAATNKRPHEGVEGEGSSTDLISAGEPPPKAAPQRRATLRPRPTIPIDRRLTASTPSTPPPPPPVT